MGLLQQVVFGILVLSCLSLAFAAPSDKAAEEKTEIEAKSDAPKKVEERAVVVADQGWDTWASNNAWPIATGTAGALLLVGGIALASYYVYFNYIAYNDQYTPYQFGPQTYPQQYTAQYYTPNIARSLDTGTPGNWTVNWGQVLYMISLAQESYEKFDFQSLDCQKKTLCEISQKQGGDFGETGRKISSTFSVMDMLDGLPMPTIIQNYLKEYKEAIDKGRRSTQDKECSTFYSKCGFSIKEVFAKYQKKAASGKF